MAHYVDDNGGSSNEALCRSMLNFIALCRFSATRLTIDDETSRREIMDALAIAEVNVRRIMDDQKANNARKR